MGRKGKLVYNCIIRFGYITYDEDEVAPVRGNAGVRTSSCSDNIGLESVENKRNLDSLRQAK
jgi:hypothetical protein